MPISTDTSLTKAYKATDLGEIKPKIIIGGKTEKFVPNTNISYELDSGKEQYFININRQSVKVDKEAHTFADSKLQLSVGNETDIWHIDKDGNLEWDAYNDVADGQIQVVNG